MFKLSFFLPLFVAAFLVAGAVNIFASPTRTTNKYPTPGVANGSRTDATDRQIMDERTSERDDKGLHNREGSTMRDANGPLPDNRVHVRESSANRPVTN